MEQDSGAKIAIRGKGSVKEGKGRSDAAHTSNQEEDLHCLIMADSEDKVNKAKQLINNVIETVSPPIPLSISKYLNICLLEMITLVACIHFIPLTFPLSKTDRILRPHPFLRGKTSSNATSFENSLHLTAHSVMMRIKPARIVSLLIFLSPSVSTHNQ
jgi:hypothetical protein